MARVDLLTVGEAFEDFVFVGLQRLPGPGEEVKTQRFVQTFGGGAIRTAVAAARLGLTCRVVSGLSSGAATFLRSEHVTFRNLRQANEAPALSVALSTRHNRSFVTFNGVNDVLEPRLLQAMRGELARHVHFSLLPQDPGRWLAVVEQLRAHGVGTSWDLGWDTRRRPNSDLDALARAVDYLFMNDQEALLYSGKKTMAKAVEYWRGHPHSVVLTLGARGSRWLSSTEDISAPPRRVKAVDTSGAGAAFSGGFLCGRLRDFSPEAALRLGNFVGAMSTRLPGGIAGLPRQGEPGL